MLEKLQSIYERFKDLEEQMADPKVIEDMDYYTKINKEYSDLKEIVEVYKQYKKLLENIETAREMLEDPNEDMREMASMELEELEPRKEKMDEEIKMLLIPKDPDDSKDVIFEIRAGTGGDEASLFAGDLYNMYTRYFDSQGWTHDLLYINEGSQGGFNKIVMEVKGDHVYGKLKFESGAHRVQRVPKTESQGRVHTSAATVAVIPKIEMEEFDVNKADLKVDTFRSSGAGGQHVNKTESGVRFTHIPTGIVAESTDSRSQIKNREFAFQRLVQKIKDVRREEREREAASRRKSLVGSGDRSDKIRTYNFSQNRVTDHRINLSLYSLDKILLGDLDEIIEALQVAENTEKMKEGVA